MKKIIVLLIISAFCPYLILSLGLRVDHILIYGLSFFAFARLILHKITLSKPIFLLMIFWIMISIFVVVRTFLTPHLSFMEILPDLDSYLEPLALLIILLSLPKELNAREILLTASKVIVLLLFLNVLWTIVGMTLINTEAINQYFWRGDTALKAASMNRYSGVFNQPGEAGLAYSLGLLGWCYISVYEHIGFKRIIFLIGLIFGGLVTVSKVFLFGGIPLMLWWIIKDANVRKHMFKIFVIGALISIAPASFILNSWGGLDYLLRFFKTGNGQSTISLLSAGRYGENGQQSEYFKTIFDTNPIYGLGLGQVQTVDSQYFQFYAHGGIYALISFSLFLILLLYLTMKYKSTSSESSFFKSLIFLIIVGGLGIPVLTVNRSSLLLWIMLCLVLRTKNQESSSLSIKSQSNVLLHQGDYLT